MKLWKRRTWGAALAVLLVPAVVFCGDLVKVDSKLPDYRKVEGVSGTIKSVGSDTMNNLMTYWAEAFKRDYPGVQIEIEGKGSGTAPPALISGASTFGPMSRPMKESELDDFEKRYGYKPIALKSSIDMLAIYVNKDNPIRGLTLAQVDAIFSKERKSGAPQDITTWGQLGLTGEWANQPISLYGRNSVSGTYAFLKEHALYNGDYKDSVKEQPGSSAVVQAVATDRYAIGYSGIGYKTADVRAVPLARRAGQKFIPAEAEYAYSGDYPLSRFLFINLNYKPDSELDPLRREFLKLVFSRQGQEIVVKAGYFPIPEMLAKKELALVGIER